jgi:uncharacterized integral membrane protein
MKFFKGLILLLIGIGVVLFAISNRDSLELYFFFNDAIIEMPVFIFFFISVLLGVVLCGLGTLIYKARVSNQLRKNKKLIKALETEISALKTETKIIENLPSTKT